MPQLPPITDTDWRSAARKFLSHYPNTSEVNCNHVIADDAAQSLQGGSNSPTRRLLFTPPPSRPIILRNQSQADSGNG
jgi:hypothetical protein